MGFLSHNSDAVNFCKNKVILAALLEKVWDLAYPVEIDGKEFNDNSIEFASQFIERPETLFLILEENKRSILYSVADNSYEKGEKISPEDYYNMLYHTFEVLYLCTDTPFANSQYKTICDYWDKTFYAVDLIIKKALEDVCDDGFWDEEVSNIGAEANTFDKFKEKVYEHVSYYIENKENASKVTNELIEIWKKEQKEEPSLLDDFKNELSCYCYQFSSLFSPDSILLEMEEYFDDLLIHDMED